MSVDRITDHDGTVDLSWYLQVLRRRWKVAAAGVLIGGTVGFLIANSRPLRYEGVTTLLIVPPAQAGAAPIKPSTFRAMVENGTLASQVISELKLDQGEIAMTPQTFLEDALQVEEVPGTNIVRVRVTLSEPQIAADASKRLAAKSIALTQQVSQQDGAATQSHLKGYLTEAQQRLTTAESELLTYKQATQVELLSEGANAQLKERGDLLRLVVDIEAEKARLESALMEIKKQPQTQSMARLPGIEDASHRPDANPVYQTLAFQIATSRTRIAAFEKARDELVLEKKIDSRELSLLRELYRRQMEQARLQANFDLASRVHSDLAMRYEQSRTQALGQLQVIDEALPPDRPVSRRRLHHTIYGSGVGLVLSVMLMSFKETRGRRV